MSNLVPVKFKPLIQRYETTAVFQDTQGQKFLIKVSSGSKEKVEQITNKLYFSSEKPEVFSV